MQDGDLLPDAGDELHVVLDDEDGAILADSIEQFRGLLAFGGAHPGHRLVEHHQLWLLHQEHPDLQPLLLTVAQKRTLCV